MDVTDQLLTNNVSSSTNAKSLASSRSLNFASGASIDKPIQQTITAFPISIEYKDTVGLFGAENAFIKFDLKITDSISLFTTIEGPDDFFSMIISRIEEDQTDYSSARELYENELDTNFSASLYNSGIKSPDTSRISVDLENVGTGNQYVDRWLDVTFYDRNRRPIEHDLIYIKPNDSFYVGFHARKTNRIPYNVKITIGREYLSSFKLTPDQRRYEG